ncbi:hypothetical protein TNCV_101191 [Trichonephila clavipes]|nr:hypothetical protein TNCV_101191 [Trichonephila clavipes]
MSSRPVSREWDNRTGGVMDKCVQMLDKNFGALGPDGSRRDEEPCLGWRELGRGALDGENGRRALDGENGRRALKEGGAILEWKGRKDDERQWRWRVGVI